MSIELVIPPRTAQIGGAGTVLRSLPYAKRRMVGPFIFLDRMGPEELAPGQATPIKPHPHIGLSTVTYLFDGELHHRDSLGTSQIVRAGDVNWMTAGRGIAHSERPTEKTAREGTRLFGVQIWVALPREAEDGAPAFAHHAAPTLPRGEEEGLRFTVVAGEAFGLRSPVETASPLFYVEAVVPAGRKLRVPRLGPEMGIYLAQGQASAEHHPLDEGSLAVLSAGKDGAIVEATTESRVLLLGGDALDGPRLIWWNFVSSSRDRLVAAREDWMAGRFAKIPGDDREFIPAPEKSVPEGIR